MARSSQFFSRSTLLLLSCCLVLTTATSVAVAQDDPISKFAKTLAELRAEVETLSTEVELAKEDQRAQLRSYSTQKSDLALQVQREERRIQQLNARKDQELEDVAQASTASEELKPVVVRSITKLRTQIEQGLPFKQGERLAALNKLEEQFNQGLISPEKAVARLWAFVEDEMRLTRENGLYRQTISIEGQEELVEVARLGMVSMYFRTTDGRVGVTKKDAGSWAYQVVSSDESVDQINGLFDAFQKQIRVGYFKLPASFGQESR